jgi:hypothetical protein
MHSTSPQLIEIELRNGGVVIPVNAYESSRRRKSEVRSLGASLNATDFNALIRAVPVVTPRAVHSVVASVLGVGSLAVGLCGSRAGVSARSLARRSPWS